MPIFSQVFAQLGTGMSAFSQTLLGLGEGLGNWSMVLVVILVILAFLFFYTTQTRAGRKLLSGFGTVIPAIRMLLYDIAASRFAGGMAMAISSGMDTSTSLQLLKNIVENDDVCKKIDKCSKDIAEGADFPEALKSAGIFSNVYTRMVKVGFRAGSMDRILSQIAEMYENQVNKRISSILSVLEPTLVIVLSLIVGLILLSVIIPLMGIMSSIG
jgi:type IV pilus assembly protein PilC